MLLRSAGSKRDGADGDGSGTSGTILVFNGGSNLANSVITQSGNSVGVPTKVSAENGAIKPGNLLVTASIPGYAMKGTDCARMVGGGDRQSVG